MRKNSMNIDPWSAIFQAAIVLLLAGTISTCCAFEQRPADAGALFRGFVAEYLQLRPETGSAIGIPQAWNIELRNDILDDESDETLDRIYGLYRKYHEWVIDSDWEVLSPSQRVAMDVLKWFLENELQGEKFRNHTYIINPMFGLHNSYTTLMTEHHRIASEKDAQDYIKRLRALPAKVSQICQRLEDQRKRGILPPVCIIEDYRQLLSGFIAVDHIDNPLYTSFSKRLDRVTNISDKTRQKLCGQVIDELERNVYPAYRAFIEHIDVALQSANHDAGVWKLPDGSEYYRYCLRSHTTTDLSPAEIHEIGLAEVKRIQAELMSEFKKMGVPESEHFASMLAGYMETAGDRDDKRYFFPPTGQGKDQTLWAYQAAIDTMQLRLPEMFSRIPRAPVKAVAVPPFKEAVMGTYYQPPKIDGSEPGIFYVNLSYQHSRSGVKALTYHEAIPGHHFQFALEQESPDVPLFKALFFFTGYVEGWALYAERLAGEYGMYNDAQSRIGYLRSELFRAVRLVVDTGIHDKKWTRERVYEYFMDNIGWASLQEIDRYITWPGQACAYKVGEGKLLELRDRAKTVLGDRFDIREFHDTILRNGSVPLNILEGLVNGYIGSAKGSAVR